MLKTEDLKSPVKDAKKMKTMSCAGSPKMRTKFLPTFIVKFTIKFDGIFAA